MDHPTKWQPGHLDALLIVDLGAAGEHAIYMAADEGRAMVDAARAAHDLPAADAGRDVVLWGYSQGRGTGLGRPRVCRPASNGGPDARRATNPAWRSGQGSRLRPVAEPSSWAE
jgi:hypothetical protein